MGTGSSKDADGGSPGEGREESLDQAGGQLYVSLKMENYKRKGDLIPHVYGSVPLVGSWDSSKAVITHSHPPHGNVQFSSYFFNFFSWKQFYFVAFNGTGIGVNVGTELCCSSKSRYENYCLPTTMSFFILLPFSLVVEKRRVEREKKKNFDP